jgi:putative DNA methylase
VALGKHVPLISTYRLSSKRGSEAWLEPRVDKLAGTYHFEVKTGTPNVRLRPGTKEGKGFRCLLTDTPIPFEYIRVEGRNGGIGLVMLAVVAELPRGRGYLTATREQIEAAAMALPTGFPDSDLPDEALGFRVQNYGIRKHLQMFTPRQLTAMVTLSNFVQTIDADVRRDGVAAGLEPSDVENYSKTITTFLALALDRCADHNNALCRWDQSPAGQRVKNLFGKHTISMLWDFAKANILGDKSVCWINAVDVTAEAIESLVFSEVVSGTARQIDAATGAQDLDRLLVSTDPPYYDNIGYADLSDFFYIWLRRTIGNLYPELFHTVLVPKCSELIAFPGRFEGSKQRAKEHFETGFRQTFLSLRPKLDPRFPLTVYYAFKQDEEESGANEVKDGNARVDLTTGWETLLEALIGAGFQITATWPVRASQAWRMRAMASNALASYIVLSCRPRSIESLPADRRSFIAELKRELPSAQKLLQQGSVAPVDFAQAAIGPGMAVYTRHSKVLDARGKPLTVREALALINLTLDESLAEQEGDFDADSRWALAWFEHVGFAEGEYGVAETLSTAKNTSVDGLRDAGIVASSRGKVRLLKADELSPKWDPTTDPRLTAWETVHQLLRVLEAGGEGAAAALVAKLGDKAEVARELCYRLYTLCERKKRASEALAYNSLVLSWPEITRLAREGGQTRTQQGGLFAEENEEADE